MIRLPRTILARIVEAAERAYPEECCGLLVGRNDVDGAIEVTAAEPAANVATPSRLDRFEVDPRVRFALMRRLRGTDLAIVGHYHSHPDGPAAPSATDLAMAYEPDLAWLIVAVAGGRAGEAAAYRLDPVAQTFQRAPLQLTG